VAVQARHLILAGVDIVTKENGLARAAQTARVDLHGSGLRLWCGVLGGCRGGEEQSADNPGREPTPSVRHQRAGLDGESVG
jgi:hypothetical protein